MAFSFTMLEKKTVEGGYVIERGVWDGASVTTGNITVDTATQPEIIRIDEFSISSDTDDTVNAAQDVNDGTLKLTFTASDTGKYFIKGKAA